MSDQPGQTTQIQDCLARLRGGDDAARAALIDHACRSLQQLSPRMLGSYPIVGRWEQTHNVLKQAMLRFHHVPGEIGPASPKGLWLIGPRRRAAGTDAREPGMGDDGELTGSTPAN